jgi:AcrR family transcriptional regulator
MTGQPRLRERKKRQARAAIRATAMRLFRERGFDGVTMTEIARAADVSRKTVFNHFPAKEDLVYAELESYEHGLLDAVRRRPAGESAVAAFERFLLARTALLADGRADPELKATMRMIASSPALLAREQQVFARSTGALAALLAREAGAEPDDPEAWIAADALIGVQRTLIAYVYRHLDAPRLGDDVLDRGRRAFRLLERGLAGYAVGR